MHQHLLFLLQASAYLLRIVTGLYKDKVSAAVAALVAPFLKLLQGIVLALILDPDQLVHHLRVIENPLCEQKGDGVGIEGQAGILHVMNDLRVADDDAQTAGCDGEELGEGAKHHHILILQRMADKGIRIEIVIGLVDDDDGAHLFCPGNDLRKLFLCVYISHRVVGIQQHHDAGIVIDGMQNVLDFDRQVRLVGHRHVLVAQDAAVDPVHLEGGSHGHDLLSYLAEGLQEIADGHVRAVRGQDVFIGCPDEGRIFMKEAIRLRVDREEFRCNLLQYGVHEFLRQSLRILIHVIAVHPVAILHREDPDGVLYMFVYMIVHIHTSTFIL